MVGHVSRWLPAGAILPDAAWRRRHHTLIAVLWAHLPVLFVLGLARNNTVGHMVAEVAPLLAAAALGTVTVVPRGWRTGGAVLGLVACSSLLVHLTNGLIESHFHFFAVIGFITLYQQWLPFLVAFCYTIGHHAIIGTLDPMSVYNHPAAWNRPVLWAGIHGGYVLLASLANLKAWRLSEDDRRQAERVLEATGDGLYGIDEAGRILFANPVMVEAVGRTADDLMGRHHHDVLGHVRHDGLPLAIEDCPLCAAAQRADGEQAADLRFSLAMASFPVEYIARPLEERGRRLGAVVTFRDITERETYENELRNQALHDPLTGLANRALLGDHLRQALARLSRSHGQVALLFCDLDRFKVVNDSLGHAAGDAVLGIVASRLTRLLRPTDTVARLGGDEFAILCEDLADEHEAIKVAERVIETLREPFSINGVEAYVGVSVGIRITDDPTTNAETLVRDADVAVYQAKEAGRGRYVLSDERLRERAEGRFQMESELHRALEAGEFEVYYQPKVSLHHLGVVGVEALLRWRQPGSTGMTPPAEFIPLAEETGLIVPIGAWVLEQACAQLDAWTAELPEGRTLTMAVNLSGRQLSHPGLVGHVAGLLAAHQFEPRQLCLELTESMLMADVATAVEVLNELHELGVTIAIDDFGTGYSSLSYLRQFPVDILKIDRSFVTGIDGNAANRSLVGAIVGMARALGMATTAEGVEHNSELDLLRTLGCDLAQGYFFAQPTPADGITPLLRDLSIDRTVTIPHRDPSDGAAVRN